MFPVRRVHRRLCYKQPEVQAEKEEAESSEDPWAAKGSSLTFSPLDQDEDEDTAPGPARLPAARRAELFGVSAETLFRMQAHKLPLLIMNIMYYSTQMGDRVQQMPDLYVVEYCLGIGTIEKQ